MRSTPYMLLIFVLNILCYHGILTEDEFVTIPTPNGQVQGIRSLTKSNNNVFYAFLGMRYAQPPLGDLRFRPPKPAPSWSGVYNATKQGNECPQSFVPTIKGDEDCLFINVYTTQLPSDSSNKPPIPVIVWFHGGAFLMCSGNLDLHGADGFLDHDVLVVSFNYRLGVFGFLCTEDDVVPGNYGIKDQVLALQWIQESIASFGGDPTQVTIWGESVGADSVHYLRQSNRTKNLFHRVIAQSGSPLNPWSIGIYPRQVAFRMGLVNGIDTDNSTILVEALRSVNASKLQHDMFVPSLQQLYDPLNGLPFAPCIEVESDEAVYTKYSYEAQKNGDFHYGPLLHGFNSLEARDFVKIPWLVKFLVERNNSIHNLLTPCSMNASESDSKIVDQHIRSYYFHNKSVTVGPNLANFVTDEFIRGIVKTSELESHYSSVYLYRFTYTGGARHTPTLPQGASHHEEMQFLLSTPENAQHTPKAKLTVQRMLEMWTNFVKTGNPTPQVSTTVNVTWPMSNATGYDSVHYLDIGDELIASVNPEQEQMKFWEEQYGRYGHPPYNTY